MTDNQDPTSPPQPGPGWGQQPGQGYGPPPADPGSGPAAGPGYGYGPQGPGGFGPAPTPPKRKPWLLRHKVLSALGAVVVVIIVAAVAASGGGSPRQSSLSAGTGSSSAPAQPEVQQSSSAPAQPAVQQSSSAPAAPQYTVAQQQAIDSAESYLAEGQGFSKAGLYQQLHSKYGEGFSAQLARFAVNHIKVNWFRQAVLSARSYMQTEPGWSYSGLVQQLDSPYGAQFTPHQAAYGARKVGL